ncbi:hypothetical protein J6590_023075 [Homalodisca vitripennis]|nr:hypothetical protein J6590_023075 [Homalodisca vitripennis]
MLWFLPYDNRSVCLYNLTYLQLKVVYYEGRLQSSLDLHVNVCSIHKLDSSSSPRHRKHELTLKSLTSKQWQLSDSNTTGILSPEIVPTAAKQISHLGLRWLYILIYSLYLFTGEDVFEFQWSEFNNQSWLPAPSTNRHGVLVLISGNVIKQIAHYQRINIAEKRVAKFEATLPAHARVGRSILYESE